MTETQAGKIERTDRLSGITDDERRAQIADDLEWHRRDIADYLADGDAASVKDARAMVADLENERDMIGGAPDRFPDDISNQGIHSGDIRYRLA